MTTFAAGIELKTIIECKDHTSKVTIGKIDEIHSKMQDINANKAIIVSRSGFSSSAIAKAKRVGVSLYTAHQALSENWKIDIQIPIVITEITPVSTAPQGIFYPQKSSSFQTPRDQFLINDINVIELFRDLWNKGNVVFDNTLEVQKISLKGLDAPYYIRDVDGDKMELKDFSIELTLKIESYFGQLDQIKNAKVLKDITDRKTTFLFDNNPFEGIPQTFKKVNRKALPQFEKLLVDILMFSKILESSIGRLDFEEIA